MCLAHVEEDMNVIGNAAYNDKGRLEAANDRGEIGVNARADGFVEKRLAIFRTED
jgi:hypothetical protein